jgi:hypothetical protein
MPMLETVLKRFEEPDEVRTFEKGKFELVRIGGMTIGRATYQPGWKWSVHVGPSVGAPRCNVEHVGLGALRLCHGCDGGRHDPRTSRWHALLHSTRTSGSRQLGGG